MAIIIEMVIVMTRAKEIVIVHPLPHGINFYFVTSSHSGASLQASLTGREREMQRASIIT